FPLSLLSLTPPPPPPISTLFPYTTLFRSAGNTAECSYTVTVNDTEKPTISVPADQVTSTDPGLCTAVVQGLDPLYADNCSGALRSEEHTSELQSRRDLVCRLLLVKKDLPT